MKNLLVVIALLVSIVNPVFAYPCSAGPGCNFPAVNCDAGILACDEDQESPTYGFYLGTTLDSVYFPQGTDVLTAGGLITCDCDMVIDRNGWRTYSDMGDPPMLMSYWGADIYERCPGHPDHFVNYSSVEGCLRTQPSPVAISLTPGGDFPMTSAEDGVDFALEDARQKLRIGWTRAGDEIGILTRGLEATDGTSLFGDRSPQAPPIEPGEPANGYRALRLLDDNNDGQISSGDAAFGTLGLWFDRNHNGVAELGEVQQLSSRVSSISLDYKKVGKRDQHGNYLRFRTGVTASDGSKKFSYDFFPAVDGALSSAVDATGKEVVKHDRLQALAMYQSVAKLLVKQMNMKRYGPKPKREPGPRV